MAERDTIRCRMCRTFPATMRSPDEEQPSVCVLCAQYMAYLEACVQAGLSIREGVAGLKGATDGIRDIGSAGRSDQDEVN